MLDWLKFFENCVLVLLAVNLLVYQFVQQRYLNKLKYFFYFLVLSLGTQIVAKYLASIGESNLVLLHIYTLFEFVILTIFYKETFQKEANIQKWLNYIIGIGSTLIIANSLFLQPFITFNSNAKAFGQIMIIGYAITYYFLVLKERIAASPVLNIINAAILLYYAGSFFVFMFSDILLKNLDRDSQILFWIFNAFLYLVFQLLVIFAAWKAYSTTKKSSR